MSMWPGSAPGICRISRSGNTGTASGGLPERELPNLKGKDYLDPTLTWKDIDWLRSFARRPVLLDVCLAKDLPRRTDMLAGATIHAPEALPRWVEELPRDRPIAVYCIAGFQISGNAVTELRKRGFDARALSGGITAWHAIGGPTVPLDTSTYEAASKAG